MSERERFLRGFHAARPGITSAALVGAASYDRLAALAAGRVLDLGCGDGYLAARTGAIGLDLSEAELAHARRRGAIVVQGRAQALPFADASFDVCLCHLALMLMDDLDAVAAELARVLAPRGRFAAIVGGGPTAAGDDAFHRFLGAVPFAAIPRLGDRRASSEAGWRALFPGWQLRFERVELDLSGSADAVWRVLGASYQLAGTDPVASRARFDAAIADLPDPVPLAMVVWLGVASR